MKRIAVAGASAMVLQAAAPAHAQLFTGDVKLACEAILCLSTGNRPDECTPSINRFFGISMKKFSDTLKAKRDFLNLCPSASQDARMISLVDAITNGAGRCDYAALNASLRVWNSAGSSGYISDALPSYCSAYSGHSYTDLKKTAAVYVGVPARGGYWVDPANYADALTEYNARIAAEDSVAAQGNSGR
jgi:hypothetical protein